jgi:hypothetical protein
MRAEGHGLPANTPLIKGGSGYQLSVRVLTVISSLWPIEPHHNIV